MKKHLLFVILLACSVSVLHAQESCTPDSVVAIDRFSDFYRYENIYIGGQPFREQFNWFQAGGVLHLVNLRTEKEKRKFKRKYFDEEALADSLGMTYTSVPIGGGRGEGIDKLTAVAEVLNTGEQVLLYCKSGARARYVFAAYLVREKGCVQETAEEIAKEMGTYLPLKRMLGKEVK